MGAAAGAMKKGFLYSRRLANDNTTEKHRNAKTAIHLDEIAYAQHSNRNTKLA